MEQSAGMEFYLFKTALICLIYLESILGFWGVAEGSEMEIMGLAAPRLAARLRLTAEHFGVPRVSATLLHTGSVTESPSWSFPPIGLLPSGTCPLSTRGIRSCWPLPRTPRRGSAVCHGGEGTGGKRSVPSQLQQTACLQSRDSHRPCRSVMGAVCDRYPKHPKLTLQNCFFLPLISCPGFLLFKKLFLSWVDLCNTEILQET